MTSMKEPRWTVHYNIVSPESDAWIGTGWEFFGSEGEATAAMHRHERLGNCAGKRPYYRDCDAKHLGAVHDSSEGRKSV